MRRQSKFTFPIPGAVVAVLAACLVSACGTTVTADNIRVTDNQSRIEEALALPALDPDALKAQIYTPSGLLLSLQDPVVDSSSPVTDNPLAALDFSFDDSESEDSLEAIPESTFVHQNVQGFARTLPSSLLAHPASIGVVLGHAGDDRYLAGVGWATADKSGNHVKLSVLRQQLTDAERDGQWLASMQGELSRLPLADNIRLQGELALARDDEDAAVDANERMAARLRLVQPTVRGIGYSVELSQFGSGFRPDGSRVEAGTRQAEANLNYSLWSDVQFLVKTKYSVSGLSDAIQRCSHKTDLALLGPVLKPTLQARLETSVYQSMNCAVQTDRHIDSWKLSLSEEQLGDWEVRVAMSMSEEQLPMSGTSIVSRSYHFNSHRELKLGSHVGSIGPMLTLHTRDGDEIQERILAGVELDLITSRLHDINVRMGYESVNNGQDSRHQDAVNLELSYRLDFGA